MSLEYNKNKIHRAKDLRRPMTKQERRLWYEFLHDYPVRFQRQKTIGSYIVDFFCHRALLVVELDGMQHCEIHAMEYDRVRTEFLQSAGIEVLRIPNACVDHDFHAVCDLIDQTVNTRKTSAKTRRENAFLREEGGSP